MKRAVVRKVKAPVDPQGRFDVLLSGLIEKAVERSQDPVLRFLFAQLKPGVDHFLSRKLGKLELPTVPHVKPQPRLKKRATKKTAKTAKPTPPPRPVKWLKPSEVKVIDIRPVEQAS